MNFKVSKLIFPLIIPTTILASTNALQRDQLYIGQEVIVNGMNEQLTGNLCYIKVSDVRNNPLGKYCYNFDYQFLSNRQDISKDIISVQTRVTNYQRPEYPITKTCATNVDGTTYNDDIYSDNSNDLVNDISSSNKKGRPNLDYFLSLSYKTKLATRARIHFLSMLKEYSVDCVNLKLIGGPQLYDLRFENEGADANISWNKKPNIGSESIMLIQFKNFDKTNINIKSKLEVNLTMPATGYNSAPVLIEQLKDPNGDVIKGLFQVKEMHFTMKGMWNINVKLISEDNKIEEHSYNIDLNDLPTTIEHNHQ